MEIATDDSAPDQPQRTSNFPEPGGLSNTDGACVNTPGCTIAEIPVVVELDLIDATDALD